MAQRKLTQKDIARFRAIDAARKARTEAVNDNGVGTKCAYVDTNMTPGMLKACLASAGF